MRTHQCLPGNNEFAPSFRALARVTFGLACMVVFLSACGNPSASEQTSPQTIASTPLDPTKAQSDPANVDPRVTIGFSIATETYILERWNKDLSIFAGAAREQGAQVIVQMSAGGSKEQIDQINYLLGQDIDVLVVIAHDTQKIAEAVRRAKALGVPVIAYDRLITGVSIDAYLSFDNKMVGQLMATALISAVPSGTYLVVNGSVRDSNSYEVNAGLMEVLRPRVEDQSIRIAEEIWLDEWSYDEALAKISALVEKHADIQAISCANDQIANAAVQVLSERKMAGKIAVVGQDADLITCQRVVEGTILMTVYKPITKLAVRAASVSISIARDQMPMPDVLISNDGPSRVPAFFETPIAVYKSNMDDTIIRDGFHAYEDVYRNLQPIR